MNTSAIPSDMRGTSSDRAARLGRVSLALLLLSLTTLPSMTMMLVHASSQAGGLAIAAAIILLAIGAVSEFSVRISTVIKQTAVIAALGCACIVHGAAASAITGSFDWSRAISSLGLVVLFYVGAYALGSVVERMTSTQIVAAMRGCFVVFVVEGVLALVGVPALAPTLHYQPIIFFIEPSHYSLAFLPFVTFMIIGERGVARLAVVGITLALGLLIQSLTLLVGVAVAVFLVLPARHLFMLLLAIIPLSAVVDTEYFMSRLVFSDEIDNLSTLAYLQGWERAILNFKSTFGMGVGFQQFGLVGELGTFQERIEKLFASSGNINLLDGGSNGSKLIGEFGLFGVLFLVGYLGLTMFAIKRLRSVHASGPRPTQEQFFAACLLAPFTEFFVRGVGYMSAGMFLLLVGMIWHARGWAARRRDTLRKKPAAANFLPT